MYPILAIDYGQKRIGLAISDKKGIIATPLLTLSITKNRDIVDLIEDIKRIIEEYRIKTVLIGRPQAFSQEHNINLERIEKFTNTLKKRINNNIVFFDESYSTSRAKDMIVSKGGHYKSKKKDIDNIAASIFLQEYLNSNDKNN